MITDTKMTPCCLARSILVVVISVQLCSVVDSAFAKDLGHREANIWAVEEYSVINEDWSGNAFDVVAKVTFVHANETRTTEMFFAGDNVWKFRLTPTRTGKWRFSSSSTDPELNGHSGTLMVRPRANSKLRGFLSHIGNKFAVMEEDIDDLNGYVYQVFMNQQDFEQQHEHPTRILGDPARAKLIDDYWNNTRENGFNIYFFSVFFSWYRMGALSIADFKGSKDPDLENPDLQLFETLERAIQHAHSDGGRCHIWAWGDNGRKQTPNHLPGGFRGPSHQRLIRYTAARLGPIPGWSMNFGFDTIEMPNSEADGAWWAEQMNRTMGWSHILTSRGWSNDRFGAHSFAGFGGNPYDLKTTDKGPRDYLEIKHDLDSLTDKPAIYEERHTYNRWRCWPTKVEDPQRLNEIGCRRLIWWEAMAGGMGGFFGHFSDRFNQYGPFRAGGPCGYHPDSLKVAFRTHRDFWNDGRLKLTMKPDNRRVRNDRGYCLSSADKRHFVFFVEDADSATVDLRGMPDIQPVVVVDATRAFQELARERLSPDIHTIPLGRVSDWAIAVGEY